MPLKWAATEGHQPLIGERFLVWHKFVLPLTYCIDCKTKFGQVLTAWIADIVSRLSSTLSYLVLPIYHTAPSQCFEIVQGFRIQTTPAVAVEVPWTAELDNPTWIRCIQLSSFLPSEVRMLSTSRMNARHFASPWLCVLFRNATCFWETTHNLWAKTCGS